MTQPFRASHRPSRGRAASTAFSLMLGFAIASTAKVGLADGPCSLDGTAVMPRNTSIYDARSGGHEIARFTGARIGIHVSAFSDDASGRAAVETTGFRIKGFVRGRDLPVYAARAIPVYTGHLWIAPSRRVAVVGSAPGRVHVEETVTTPVVGSFQSWAPCDAVTFSEHASPGWTPSGGERGYVLEKDEAALFTAPNGDAVTTLTRASAGFGVLFFSDNRDGAWVHVEHHGDILIDAWARARDLKPLPPGETMDQLAPSIVKTGTASLHVQGNTKVVRVESAAPLRAAASDAAATVGSLSPGVEVIVLDVVAGWASVIPKDLGLAPVGDNQFWARSKDLGL